jgi:hypothetical protein
MAAQSKAAESKGTNPLGILGPAIFVSVLSFAATLPLRPLLLQQILGDAEAVSMMLARITASGALSEFIFNPLFGRASTLPFCLPARVLHCSQTAHGMSDVHSLLVVLTGCSGHARPQAILDWGHACICNRLRPRVFELRQRDLLPSRDDHSQGE